MSYARLGLRLVALIFALALGAYLFAYAMTTAGAQSPSAKILRPDLRRALASKTKTTKASSSAARARS